MAAKVIDSKCFADNADELKRVTELAGSIKKRHQLIATETEKIDAEKKEITDISSGIFFKDVEDAEVPAVHGNHEYHTPDGDLVSVNFKIQSPSMTEINKNPADVELKKQFGDAYGKLFDEAETHAVTAKPDDLLEQAQITPDLFALRLKALTPEQMVDLVSSHPDLVEVNVKDLNRYAVTYPSFVATTKAVKPKAKFLDKVAKLDGPVLQKVRKFLTAFLKPTVKTAVLCGNTSKTK